MHASIVTNTETGHKTVALFVPGRGLFQADSTHPNFKRILTEAQKVTADDNSLGAPLDGESFANLFDLAGAIASKFRNLSSRISVANGQLYFDGDPMHTTLADHILRGLEQDDESVWKPLVLFVEFLAGNPDEHSRDNAYRWLNSHKFTINEKGLVVGYKGLRSDMTSVHSGPAIVNGEEFVGHVPNQPGNTVEMSRSSVEHNPSVACGPGLHIGDWTYANSFGAVVVEVEFNPQDIVSVPTDCGGRKLRARKYTVLGVVTGQRDQAVVTTGNSTGPHVKYHNKRGPGGRFVKA